MIGLMRHAALAALMLGAAPHALAQTQRIDGVNRDVFRTLQYLGSSRASHNWTTGDTGMMMRAIMKDLVYDDAEKSLVEALRKETFDLVIAPARAPDFNPNDIVRKGALPAEARAQLASGLTPDAFAAEEARQKNASALQAAPAPGESQIAFFLRTGREGFAKLAAFAGTGPEAWTQARSAIVAEFRSALTAAIARDRQGMDRGRASFEISRDVIDAMRGRLIDAGVSSEARLLVLEAAAAFDVEQTGAKLFLGALGDLIGGEDKAQEMLEIVCRRLGIDPAAL
jgi:hypothetical protein